MPKSLATLVTIIESHKGSWQNTQLAQNIKMFLWATYDPEDELIYPNINNWDDLLAATIENDNYSQLNEDEVLSILFGLNHRNRIVEGLWWSMFERGVTQKLLKQLSTFGTDNTENIQI
jgi:hypothetical protein